MLVVAHKKTVAEKSCCLEAVWEKIILGYGELFLFPFLLAFDSELI